MAETKTYTNLVIEKKDNSEIEIKAQIPEEIVLKYKDRAVKNLVKTLKLTVSAMDIFLKMFYSVR